MSKTGRNDPCPCGSGKKYKKCCAGKSDAKPAPADKLPTYLNPSLIAKQWLANQSQNSNDSKIKLILDRFEISSADAVKKIRAMGKVEEDSVLFYRGKKWVGEADLSIAGELLLTTADSKVSDKLCTELLSLENIKHISRSEDTFDPVDQESSQKHSAEMLSFKKTFFAAWPDEVNEKLEGLTPRQAVQSQRHRGSVKSLLAELEKREAKLPKKQRYKFAQIRSELGL